MAIHPMVAVFSRMQCPGEVYQLNLPGSREAATDFLINTPWSRMPLCKFLEKIPKSLLQATRPRVRLEMSGVRKMFAPEIRYFVEYLGAFHVTLKSGTELPDARGFEVKS